MEFFRFVNLGGPINWILFFLMCICLCLIIERTIFFFSTNEKSKNSFIYKIKKSCKENENQSTQIKRKNLEQTQTTLYYEMSKGLWFLNFASAVAPSIGLLGTVVGLISAFQGMSASGSQVNIQDLSGGIWVAMITTEFGMLISIPTLFVHRTFKRIIEKRMVKINFIAEDEIAKSSGEKN